MTATGAHVATRRGFVHGAAAIAGLAGLGWGGGALAQPAPSATGAAAAVRRLMQLSAQNARAKLTATDGYWTSTVARINLPTLFAARGAAATGKLASADFRADLQHRLNTIAVDGTRRTHPQIARAATRLVISDPSTVLATAPTGATTVLRQAIGARLVNAMIPTMRQALAQARDPVVTEAMRSLKGVSLTDVAHALANEADNAIWYEVGAEEAAIRRDPASTGDAVLTAALTPAPA